MSSRAKFLKSGALLATSATLLTNCSEMTSQPGGSEILPSTAGRTFDFSATSVVRGTRGTESVSTPGNGTIVVDNPQSRLYGSGLVAGSTIEFSAQWERTPTIFRTDVKIGQSTISIYSDPTSPIVGAPQKTTYSDGSTLTRTLSNSQNGSGILANVGGESWTVSFQVNGNHLLFTYDGPTTGSLVSSLSGTNTATAQRGPMDVSNCGEIAQIGWAFDVAALWGGAILLPGSLIVGGIGVAITGYADVLCH